MEQVYSIYLMPSESERYPLFKCVQGDTNTRKISATILNDDGSPFQNESGITATYQSRKPDGTGTSHSATITASSTSFVVSVTLTAQDLAAPGTVKASIILTKSGTILATMPFEFTVVAVPMGSNVQSTSDYQQMQDATDAANTATQTANTAATTAVQTANNAAQQALSIANTAADNANDAAEYATEAANTASNYNIDLLAEGYDATAIYVTGDYCIYQGALYRCITDIVTPEAWTASHWLAVELGADVQNAQRDATEGYSDTLTAGDLTSDEYAEDAEPYLFRRTYNGANNHEMDTLVGGTVAWNQLEKGGRPTETKGGITYSPNEDGSFTLDGTASSDPAFLPTVTSNAPIIVNGHKYLAVSNFPIEESGLELWIRVGNSRVYQCTNPKGAIYAPTTDNTGIQLAYRILAGTVVSNINVWGCLYDITQMFGSAIADYIYSLEQATIGAGIAWVNKYIDLSVYHAYDSGTLKSVEAVAHRMVGKNLIDDSQATSQTLNGVTFTVNRNSDGSVESVIANGTASSNASFRFVPTQPLNYGGYILTGCPSGGSSTTYRLEYYDETASSASHDTGNGVTIPDTTNGHACRVVCAVRSGYTANNLVFKPMIRYADTSDTFEPHKQHTYKLSPLTLRGITKLVDGKLQYDGDTYDPSGQMVRRYGTRAYQSGDESLADAITDGTNTVYKLTTPTTETASPYEPTQVVYADGTEEYISQNIVPVGHNTRYPVSIKQALTQIAKAPSANGTYVLKCVVADGVASYSWVTE